MLNDDEFRILLNRLNRPWAGFRKVRKGVKKRIRRHMRALDCSTIEQYLHQLHRQPTAMAACQKALRVTISRFFRDRQVWRFLQGKALPDLVNRFPAPIRIWSAGCACGEEPYSLAMVWNEMAAAIEMDLLATDADGTCLDRARIGRYPAGSVKEVPAGLKQTYFQHRKGGRQMQIRHDRLPPVRWQIHDLMDLPPGSESFHLILLRNNLLTYYRGSALKTALVGILMRLSPGGYLVIGSHEQLPADILSPVQLPSCPWVYRLDG